VMIDITRPGVRFALRASISDTVPDTSGAAKLVPMPFTYAGPPGTVVPSLAVERT